MIQEMEPVGVRVEVKSEKGSLDEPARVLVYDGSSLVAEVVARVEMKPGADGGLYSCVTLEKQQK